MRFAFLLVPCILLAGCDPVPTQSVAEGAAMEVETNEALAQAHLVSIGNAQVQARALCIVDTDRNGAGEFLFLDELTGARPARTPGQGLRMSLLIDEFKHRSVGGFVEVHGYLYLLLLPGKDGTWVDEGEADSVTDEMRWRCYAWPVEYGRTGRRSFFIDESGVVRAREAPGLSGTHAPDADAAFDGGEPAWPPCAEVPDRTEPAEPGE
jgi:hypothetical protein